MGEFTVFFRMCTFVIGHAILRLKRNVSANKIKKMLMITAAYESRSPYLEKKVILLFVKRFFSITASFHQSVASEIFPCLSIKQLMPVLAERAISRRDSMARSLA